MSAFDNFGSEKIWSDENSEGTAETVLPVFVEEASVSKRRVETGRVKVSTTTHQHEQVVEELLEHQRVEVERKPIGQFVSEVPAIREEAGVLIVPVVEEQIVVERRLVLKEEVRVKRIIETETFQDRVPVRQQEVTVTRLTGESSVTANEK